MLVLQFFFWPVIYWPTLEGNSRRPVICKSWCYHCFPRRQYQCTRITNNRPMNTPVSTINALAIGDLWLVKDDHQHSSLSLHRLAGCVYIYSANLLLYRGEVFEENIHDANIWWSKEFKTYNWISFNELWYTHCLYLACLDAWKLDIILTDQHFFK